MTNKSATAQELRNTTADPVSDSPTPASAADPLGICPGCGMPNDHDMYRCVQNHIERTRGMVASPQPHQQDLPPDSPVSAGMASAADPLGICPGYVIVPIDKLEFVCRLLDANQCQNTAKELRTMLATAIESAAAQDETPQVEKCKEPVPAAAPLVEPVAKVTYSNWNGISVEPLPTYPAILPVGTVLYTITAGWKKL